ncbi:MAG: MarR family transcriptional regulator [Erysipelotrichaceae bacterium]|nr:MarR family transcriptional regulator [Erysipelotrichaceae bacterium]MDD3924380.1 MarR family transcriptional regulator [Erysipelotrichaceae bacterium]MDD4643271.1 MarR family transcriptional regulator [Erysipelotrichaceae bacterium]
MVDSLLKLDKQLCFPLYVASKSIISQYKPMLDELDLTYTQYIAMMVLWEHKNLSVKKLGEALYLDSGTLTPLLKKLENKDYLRRVRDNNDERIVNIILTEKGYNLEKKAQVIPLKMKSCINLEEKEANRLYDILYRIIDQLNSDKQETVD